MARNTSFSLTEHFTAFIEDRVRSGRYQSASDVVRAGLRLLEEEEAKLARLRDLIEEGERSGPARPWDFDEFLARKNAEHAARQAKEA